MAISAVHYQLLKEHSRLLRRNGSLLEIGEANWYGDMDPREMRADILTTIQSEYQRERVIAEAKGEDPAKPPKINSEIIHLNHWHAEIVNSAQRGDLFAIAKACYQILFAPSIVEAVDLNGTPTAFRQNLNAPLTLPRQYDTVINHGTAEHIFNIAQLFASIHQATKIGGYMIHECPFTGWIDHGFYCLQPTLFYDLAAANQYELVSLSITHIMTRQIVRLESRDMCHRLAPTSPKDAMLFAVLKQATAEPFRIPMQGVYSGKLSKEGMEAWHTR